MGQRNGVAAMSLDYTGEQGGLLSMAFAAGCLAASAFWGVIGRFMWSVLGKAKDDRIEQLEATIAENEARCAETAAAQSLRVQQLETLLLLHGSGALRQDLQRVISERRVEEVLDNETGR